MYYTSGLSTAASSATSGEGSAKTDAAPSAISDAVTATNKGGDFDNDALTTWAPIEATRRVASHWCNCLF